jgi:HlyD family secretion protein
MADRRRIIAFALLGGLALAAAGVGGYFLWRPEPAAAVVGVVRTTEIRIAPEVGGQLAAIKVQKGAQVRAGEVVAELSALELSASVAQARAALAAATADREHVYAGVRAEEVAGLAAEIAKAKSRLDYAQAQLDRTAYLARSDFASQQSLDQAENDVASARADVAEAQANHAAALAGPTREGGRDGSPSESRGSRPSSSAAWSLYITTRPLASIRISPSRTECRTDS